MAVVARRAVCTEGIKPIEGFLLISCQECETLRIDFFLDLRRVEDGVLHISVVWNDSGGRYFRAFDIAPSVSREQLIEELRDLAQEAHKTISCPYLAEVRGR